jgi:hypothetical protein
VLVVMMVVVMVLTAATADNLLDVRGSRARERQ